MGDEGPPENEAAASPQSAHSKWWDVLWYKLVLLARKYTDWTAYWCPKRKVVGFGRLTVLFAPEAIVDHPIARTATELRCVVSMTEDNAPKSPGFVVSCSASVTEIFLQTMSSRLPEFEAEVSMSDLNQRQLPFLSLS